VALGDNAILALFDDGEEITVAALGAIGAGKFVRPGGNFQAGPLLDVSTPTSPLTGGNLPQVQACVAGEKALGVTKWDTAASGDVVGLYCGVQAVPMVAGATVIAGQEVQSDANGLPIPLAAGRSNGVALNGGAGGATIWVKLSI
jgi:hypothetical protein